LYKENPKAVTETNRDIKTTGEAIKCLGTAILHGEGLTFKERPRKEIKKVK